MKANRETIVLIAAACAMTFVLSRHASTTTSPESPAPVVQQQVWTGHLAQVAPDAGVTPSEPMSSASLVVPKSALALPAAPRKAPAKVAAPVPPTRTQVANNTLLPTGEEIPPRHDDGLLHKLNPMNHLPDMASVQRPFAYAGETIAGWMRHF